MGKYMAEYKCGHTEEVQLGGTYASRRERLEWYKENALCPACRAEQRKKEAEEQAQKDTDAGLPALTGSPKQIQWATMIRKEYIDELDDALFRMRTEQSPEVARTVSRQLVLAKQTEAKWWIDHRDMSALAILKGACKLEGLDSPEKRAAFAAGEQPKSC